MAQTEESRHINEILGQLFRAHGVDSTLQELEVVFPENTINECIMKASALILQEIKRPNLLSVELEVRFVLTSGRTIVEAFAGVGTTREEAIAEAFGNFASNSFHVLLAVFFQASAVPANQSQVSQEEWMFANHRRRVTIGNLGIRGTPPVSATHMAKYLENFAQKIKQKSLSQETHWIRFYYAQAKEKMVACEVLLDNNEWEAMQLEMLSLTLPSGEDFYSMRVFLIIEGGNKSAIGPAKLPRWQFWKR